MNNDLIISLVNRRLKELKGETASANPIDRAGAIRRLKEKKELRLLLAQLENKHI